MVQITTLFVLEWLLSYTYLSWLWSLSQSVRAPQVGCSTKYTMYRLSINSCFIKVTWHKDSLYLLSDKSGICLNVTGVWLLYPAAVWLNDTVLSCRTSLSAQMFMWHTLPFLLLIRFVSFDSQHQHTPTQPHKNLNLSIFNQLEIIGYLTCLQKLGWRHQGCKKWKKQGLFLYCIFTFRCLCFVFNFLTLFSLFSSLVGKFMITQVDQISWKHLINGLF